MPAPARLTEPSGFRQAGMSTHESRGMLIRIALSRSGDRWARIVVSDRWPTTCPAVFSYLPFAPARVSDPISRKFSALRCLAASRIAGSFGASASMRCTFPDSLRYS